MDEPASAAAPPKKRPRKPKPASEPPPAQSEGQRLLATLKDMSGTPTPEQWEAIDRLSSMHAETLALMAQQAAQNPEEAPPEPEPTLFDPEAQKAYDLQAVHQATSNVRQQLAQAKVSWRLVQAGAGPEAPKGKHANQLAAFHREQDEEHQEAIRTAEKRIEVLCAVKEEVEASETGIAGPPAATPALHVPTTAEVAQITKAGGKARRPRMR